MSKVYKGYELIKAITENKIKDNTTIKVIDELTGNCISKIEYKNQRLNWVSGEFDTSFLCNIDIEFVIEEEEEETEEITELRIAGIITEEIENKVRLKEVLNDNFYDILNKTNELVRAVNKINKEREGE